MTLEQVNDAYRELIALLRSVDRGVDFRIANSVWTRQNFPIRPEFLERTHASFDAESRSLDFGAPSSVDVINAWVKTATNGKIPTIVEQIPPDMVAYLINAIYFKGSWRSRFDAAQTSPAPFTSAGGTTQMAPAMNQTHDFAWYRGNGFEAVDLPYSRGAFSMTVILPDPGSSPAAVLERLDADTWAQLAAFPSTSEVALRLPKFTLEDEHALIPALQSLGMRDAFDDSRADFSLLSPVGGLVISEVKQKTFVDVHEEGTEAAAVTSVGIVETSAPQQRPFVVDRPFLFVLRERFSGAILFMGRIGTLPVS
jgi:serpin B